MSKLVFKTKAPEKGYINYEGFMTHEAKGLYDKMPPNEVQNEAMEIVCETMQKLINQLKELGYDQTKVGFYIHYKE